MLKECPQWAVRVKVLTDHVTTQEEMTKLRLGGNFLLYWVFLLRKDWAHPHGLYWPMAMAMAMQQERGQSRNIRLQLHA